MTDEIPFFYNPKRNGLCQIERNIRVCQQKRQYFTEHMKELYSNTNPAALWKVIIKYKSPYRSCSEGTATSASSEYNRLQLTYDGYHKMAYELLFGVTPEEEEQAKKSAPAEAEWRRAVYFHHPFLSPANFLLFSKSNGDTVSAVVVYAFVAKRLLLFRLRVELEVVASVVPCTLIDRSTRLGKLALSCKASPSSPLSNALCQEDIEAFILRILPNLRFARDMPHWMQPYYLCHASRKFMFMCDLHRIGSIPIDTFMKSDAFSELLHIFESDAKEAIVVYPVGCPVEVPISVLLSSSDPSGDTISGLEMLDEEDTITAVVTAFEGEGNQLEDIYTVELIPYERLLQIPRSQLFWNASCANYLEMENISMNNWFFFGLVERIYEHFTTLDADGDGVLTEAELTAYNDASFTKLVIHRVFEMHVPFSGDRHVMDFKHYLNFVLATEYPTAKASVHYIWRLLDLDGTHSYIHVDVLRCFCRDLAQELRSRRIMLDITADMILSEVLDMINPAWHEHVTLEDIEKSGHEGTVFPILLSFRNFSTYDSREGQSSGDEA